MESFIALCLLLWIGHLLRTRVGLLRRLYLPSSVIAGLLGLIVIQCVLHFNHAGYDQLDTLWLGRWVAGWGKLPGFLINIVFACLFLGVTMPGVGGLFKKAGPQLAYGQIVAWGQYVVGLGVALGLLGGWLGDLPPVAAQTFGTIIPIGFEGGHGTAGGLISTFNDLGWPAGSSFALASATVGIISAIVVGMALVNWAIRRGHVAARSEVDPDTADDLHTPFIPLGQRPSAGKLTVNPDAIETLTLHVAVIGLAVLFGWGVKQLMLGGVEALYADLPAEALAAKPLYRMIRPFPTFPLCMIGGLLIQVWEQNYDRHQVICGDLMKRIQGVALDFLVVAAIATIRVSELDEGLTPFVILVAAGIAWNVFCVLVLARRLLPDAWFERAIAELGQSMGVTATGLLLLRVVDPEYRTPAAEAFAAKQVMHEPFMGGGLWTSAALPMAAIYGGWRVFTIAAVAVGAWLVIAAIMQARHRRSV